MPCRQRRRRADRRIETIAFRPQPKLQRWRRPAEAHCITFRTIRRSSRRFGGRAPWPACSHVGRAGPGVRRRRGRPPHILVAAMLLCGAGNLACRRLLGGARPIVNHLLAMKRKLLEAKLPIGCRMMPSCPLGKQASRQISDLLTPRNSAAPLAHAAWKRPLTSRGQSLDAAETNVGATSEYRQSCPANNRCITPLIVSVEKRPGPLFRVPSAEVPLSD
jgi:hypothetical protein